MPRSPVQRGRQPPPNFPLHPSGCRPQVSGALCRSLLRFQKIAPKSDAIEDNLMISLLFIAADPTDASRIRTSEEYREIAENLQRAKLRDRFTLDVRLAARPSDLSQALLDVGPQIVHFSGHGTRYGALCLEDRMGRMLPVEPDALASLFEQFSNQVKVVVLNACYAELQAKAISRHVDYVIVSQRVEWRVFANKERVKWLIQRLPI